MTRIKLFTCKCLQFIFFFYIDTRSKKLWVNKDSGTRVFELTLHTALKCPQVKLDSLDIGGMWADCSNMNKAWASAAVFLSAQLSGGGTARTVYFVFLTNIQQLCRYFLVIQCCRKSGKYTPPPHKSEKKKCVPFENKAQGFIYFIWLSHIYFYLWFFSPPCMWLYVDAVNFRGSLKWNWTHRHIKEM